MSGVAAGPRGPEPGSGVAPVRRFLLAEARQDAERVRAAAAADAGAALARARAEAEAILSEARAAGAAQGTALAASDLAEARRQARTIVLRARGAAYGRLRGRVRAAVGGLRDDPGVRDRLRTLARDLAGPDARVAEHEAGGFVATGPGTRADCSLPALADRAVEELGEEVERLWAS